jgi:hypothetical protein
MKKKQLIINIEDDGLVNFENLKDFEQIELIGILHCAVATVDVLYKTKLMQFLGVVSKDKKQPSKK